MNMPHDQPIPYGRQWIGESEQRAVADVLRSDYLTQGPVVGRFESEVCAYTGAATAVACASGTAGLHAACHAAGIGPGDEVITSALTFAASANAVLYCGARPVFADIDPSTLNIAPASIERCLGPRTRAIVAVDFAGLPHDADAISAIAERHGLTVIEDAAHSLGATYHGRRIGTLAPYTVFSFHAVKTITTGEGGMVLSTDAQRDATLRAFRTHGMVREPSAFEQAAEGPWWHEMQDLGFNYRISDIQCALGLAQLARLDDFLERRRWIADRYLRAFGHIDAMICPPVLPELTSAWHIFPVQFELTALTASRRQLYDAYIEAGILVQVHYIPVYFHPYYAKLGYVRGLCPEVERYYARALTLPIFPRMDDADVDRVIDVTMSILKRFRR